MPIKIQYLQFVLSLNFKKNMMGMNQINILVYLRVESIQKLSYGNLIKNKKLMIKNRRHSMIIKMIFKAII